jgi:hypothetical protein
METLRHRLIEGLTISSGHRLKLILTSANRAEGWKLLQFFFVDEKGLSNRF